MKKNKDQVIFYSEKLMSDGKVHYASGIYNNVTGIVLYLTDYIDALNK